MAGDRERVWSLFGVLADVELGASGLVVVGGGPIIHFHYEMLAIGCVLD